MHAEIREVTLDVSTDRTLSSAESYAYHSQFLGSSAKLYQPATLARIQSAEKTSAVAALLARRELDAARHSIRKIFDQVDILLTPTVPTPPQAIADLEAHPENLRPAELLMLRNTRPFNVWGIPAISVPCGFTSGTLPIGLQLAAAPWREDLLLQVAHGYEQATGWHTRTPAVSA
jgi:Asp-tRNA(Asn)/Glu-tRNA(Gln) amidotransferase A subunit family amidase